MTSSTSTMPQEATGLEGGGEVGEERVGLGDLVVHVDHNGDVDRMAGGGGGSPYSPRPDGDVGEVGDTVLQAAEVVGHDVLGRGPGRWGPTWAARRMV